MTPRIWKRMEPGYYVRRDGRAIVERGVGTGRWYWTTWTGVWTGIGRETALRRAQRSADLHLERTKGDDE
jgi:hypothetical protein